MLLDAHHAGRGAAGVTSKYYQESQMEKKKQKKQRKKKKKEKSESERPETMSART